MGLRIGAEFEFLSKSSRSQVKQQLKADLGFICGADRGTYSRWYLTGDGSLHAGGLPGYGWIDHELISPIMSFETGVKKIKKIFEWMGERDHRTNESCGFHVGMSYSDNRVMQQLNKTRLLVAFNEDDVLAKFKRKTSHYCMPQRVRNNLNTVTAILPDGSVAKVIVDLDGFYLDSDKYHSVNIGKLDRPAGKKYVEFRAMGGKGYHKRIKLVEDTIRHYADCMEFATSGKQLKPSVVKDLFESVGG